VSIHHDIIQVRNTSWYSYAFRSSEKAALQEIGPRFTLKLRSLKKGIPVVNDPSKPPPPLEFANDKDAEPTESGEDENSRSRRDDNVKERTGRVGNTNDDFEWIWKVNTCLDLITGANFHTL
jgi:ribosome production factor 1